MADAAKSTKDKKETKAAEQPAQQAAGQPVAAPVVEEKHEQSFRLAQARAFIIMLLQMSQLWNAVLIALGFISFALFFPFYTFLLPIFAIIVFVLGYHNPIMGTVVSFLLILPAVAFQTPVLAWLFLVVIGAVFFTVFSSWYIIAALLFIVSAPFAPEPFNMFLGPLVIPVLALSALRLGSKKASYVIPIAIYLVLLLSVLWQVHNASFLTVSDNSFATMHTLIPSKEAPEVIGIVPGIAEAVANLFSFDVIQDVNVGIGLVAQGTMDLFFSDAGFVQILLWSLALYGVAYLPLVLYGKWSQFLPSLALLLLIPAHFISAEISGVDFDIAVVPATLLTVGLMWLMDNFNIKITREEEIVAETRRGAFGIPGLTDLSVSRTGPQSLSEVGNYDATKREIRESILMPLEHRELTVLYNVRPPKGILLFGPPGTGKTLLMSALAKELRMNFYYVKTADILGQYLGESERHITELFKVARKNAPCVTGDTVITLGDGSEITVKELFENPKPATVMSMTKDFKVLAKRIIAMQCKEPKDIVNVLTSIGTIRCTPDHLFPVLENGRLVWTEAKELKGKFVATPRRIPIPYVPVRFIELLPSATKVAGATAESARQRILEIGLKEASRILRMKYSTLQSRLLRAKDTDLFMALVELEHLCYPRHLIDADKAILQTTGWGTSITSSILLPETVDEEVMYALGLLWSDGSFEKTGRRFQFSGDHPHLHNRLKQILEEKFGVHVSVYLPKSGKCIVTKCSSSILVAIFQNLQKRILTLPENLVAAWLRGVFDGDGHITADGSKICVGVTKPGNRKLLQNVLLRVGIPTVDHKGNNLELSSASQKEVYLRKVGFEHPLKLERARRIVFNAPDSKSRLDVIPLGSLLKEARNEIGIGTYDTMLSHSVIYGWENYGTLPSRERVSALCGDLETKGKAGQALAQMKKLAASEIFWAKVIDVRSLEEKEAVYDLQVEETENFLANGMFVHNCVLFFDEIDSIGKKRDMGGGDSDQAVSRALSTILTEMDGMKEKEQIIVVAATNVPNQLDPALLRPGRIDKIIYMPPPDAEGREAIFNVVSKKIPLDKDVDFKRIAKITERFTGADITNVVLEAARRAAPAAVEKGKVIPVKMDDFTSVLKTLKPSTTYEMLEDYDKFRRDYERRSVKEEIKPVEERVVSWNDVIGLDDVRKVLTEAIELPLLHEDELKKYDVRPAKGLLLFGPPGTGKTLIVKAASHELNATFIGLSPADISRYGYENAVRLVKETFNKARENAPAVIFIDELESLVPSRDLYQSKITEEIVSEFLQQLDGMKELKNVMLVGATNKPQMIDPALLRPGRFDKILFVGPPTKEGRIKLFQHNLEGIKGAESIDYAQIAEETEGFTGADIAGICQDTKMQLVRAKISGDAEPGITTQGILDITSHRSRSVTVSMLKEYLQFVKDYGERR